MHPRIYSVMCPTLIENTKVTGVRFLEAIVILCGIGREPADLSSCQTSFVLINGERILDCVPQPQPGICHSCSGGSRCISAGRASYAKY